MHATTLSRLRAGTLGLALATAATSVLTTGLVLAPSAHALGTGTISGRVTNTAGSALEEMDVTAFKNVAGAWTEEVATTETEEDGTYSLPIEAGTYRIEFTDSADEYVDQWWDRAASADLATDVVVGEAGDASGRNAVLSANGTALVNLTLPRISGTPAFGAKLKADPGTWSQPGATFTYEWLVLGRAKLGGTGQTFTLEQPADKPAKLRVLLIVTAHAPGFDDVDAGTDELEVTGTSDDGKGGSKGALSVTRDPKITGKAQVGRVLRAVPGKATPKARATYTWLRGSRAIAGATGRTYRPVAADAGKRLSVKVTWTRAGSAPVVARSPRTLPVKK